MNDSELMTAREVADMLRVTTTTLATWRRKSPESPRFVLLGNRCIRYRRDEIKAYISERTSMAS